MRKYICTRAFQFRGTMIHAGTVVSMDERTAETPFVSSHVKRIDGWGGGNAALSDRKEETVGRLEGMGNGQEMKKETPPAAVARVDPADLTDGQIKSLLAKLGVHYSNKMTREELVALYVQAQQAVAGSAYEPSAPIQTGK